MSRSLSKEDGGLPRLEAWYTAFLSGGLKRMGTFDVLLLNLVFRLQVTSVLHISQLDGLR